MRREEPERKGGAGGAGCVVAWPVRLRRPHANPYPHLLYRALAARGWEVVDALDFLKRPWRPFHILHLHWPESGFGHRGLRRLVLLWPFLLGLLARLHGARVVWTVHNVRPHDPVPEGVLRLFHRLLSRLVDGLIFLGPRGMRDFARQDFAPFYRGRPARIVPHGHYRGFYPDGIGRAEARARFGFSPAERVLLVFGKLRAYKGIEELADVLLRLPDPRIRLLIAGEPHTPEDRRRLRAVRERDRRIRLEDRPFAPEEVQEAFGAADLVVLPYRRITNSGAAILALSFARPVLAPRLGELVHLAERVPGWVRLYDPPLRPEVLAAALAEPAGRDLRELEAFLRETSWERVAERTDAFFRRLLADPAATAADAGDGGREAAKTAPGDGAEEAVPPPAPEAEGAGR